MAYFAVRAFRTMAVESEHGSLTLGRIPVIIDDEDRKAIRNWAIVHDKIPRLDN